MKKLQIIINVIVLALAAAWLANADVYNPIYATRIMFGLSGPTIKYGTLAAGSSDSAGSLWLRTVGGDGAALSVKSSAGWAAIPTSSSTATLTGKTYDAEGTGNVLTLPFTEWWPAAPNAYTDGAFVTLFGFNVDVATGGTYTAAITDSNYTYGTIAFADGGTQTIYRDYLLPPDWTGNISVAFVWWTTATSGNVVWQLQTQCTADNETMAPASFSFNAAQTVVDAAKGSSSLLNTASISPVTTTGCAAGELMHLKFFRDPTNGSDTIGATAQLVGIGFTYRRAM